MLIFCQTKHLNLKLISDKHFNLNIYFLATLQYSHFDLVTTAGLPARTYIGSNLIRQMWEFFHLAGMLHVTPKLDKSGNLSEFSKYNEI